MSLFLAGSMTAKNIIKGLAYMKKIALLLMFLALTGCKPGEEKAIELAKNELSEGLKDPDGAKFKNIHVADIHEEQDGSVLATVCGQLNAKNSFNAYVGYRKFIVMLSMKEKSFFGKGVTYDVITSKVLESYQEESIFRYEETCSPND